MKIKIRRSNITDLDNIYNLHINCFDKSDQWYKSIITQYLKNGIIIEFNNNIIGVLLQGHIIPFSNKLYDDSFSNYKEDIFDPINDLGQTFYNNNNHIKEIKGILMICIDPNYRGKGLGKKLINKFFDDNKNNLVCLNTRKSNIKAFMLYKSLGFLHIAYIRNKYFLPTEDSVFMIKQL